MSYFRQFSGVWALCGCVLVTTITAPLSAQTVRPLRQQPLPVVPNLEPRPAEGPQESWRTQRVGNERQPTAAFLDSLSENDAVIKVKLARSKLLTTKEPIAEEGGVAVIAVSDPSVLDFDVLPDSRMIRLAGQRVGTSDLTFVGVGGQTYSFEVRVVYDLDVLNVRLRELFPDARINLTQIREHIVVEGQARSDAQVDKILDTIRFFLASEQVARRTRSRRGGERPTAADGAEEPPPEDEEAPAEPGEAGDEPAADETDEPGVAYEEGDRPNVNVTFPQAQIINLLTVPGVQQIMLKVQIAELNRTALREIGTDLFANPGNNTLLSFGGALGESAGEESGSIAELLFSNATGTLVGIFDSGRFAMIMKALRQNSVADILAEPNLVTLNGHEARFLSGGEFPVPVAQQGGGAGNNTVEFKDFGIQLAFIPHILDDGVIRLHVEPEVSNVDESLGVTLIIAGDPIPGVRTRTAATTVELREGQTLAIAGLLSREADATTSRIPLIGDIPYLGVFFGSNRHQVQEQELLVAVTPFLVEPMSAEQRPPIPGTEIMEPNDLEFYLMQRIEGRTGRPHRSTTQWDNPFHHQSQMQVEQRYFVGPVGLSE